LERICKKDVGESKQLPDYMLQSRQRQNSHYFQDASSLTPDTAFVGNPALEKGWRPGDLLLRDITALEFGGLCSIGIGTQEGTSEVGLRVIGCDKTIPWSHTCPHGLILFQRHISTILPISGMTHKQEKQPQNVI
jgi:hypothetical protein